ncbi:MAG: hypothetical protein HN368_03660, partial [Spirochaetales bacterium]|nr:hypothetical protein [Spirochaetales bacterium]
GGRVYQYDAPIDILPLFVKSGAIIPMQEDVQYIEDKVLEKIILDIYLYGESSFFYRDDYESFEITAAVAGDVVKIVLPRTDHQFSLRLNCSRKIQLEINGEIVSQNRLSNEGNTILLNW